MRIPRSWKAERRPGPKPGPPAEPAPATRAGAIAATIADANADHFTQDDYEFLKFHGVYQQDDRDLRKTGKHYIMMVRTRIPGGVMTAGQWRWGVDSNAWMVMMNPIQMMIASPASAGTAQAMGAMAPVRQTRVIKAPLAVE